jgi:SAM-dependent MidA family methyltransferase
MLDQLIIQKIKEEGPIPFHDFMDAALYYPGLGYYTSFSDKLGITGDYYTSCYLTPAFGATIARQLHEMWNICGKEQFTIVEFGAGTGMLCRDILEHAQTYPEFYEALSYCIIEKSPAMREKEHALLTEKVSWHNSLQEIGSFTGCVLSNELLDNFPVHRVVMQEELKEIYVDHRQNFTEVLRPARQELKNYLRELEVQLPEGFHTEINLLAIEWMKEISECLKKGYVLTIDYGFSSSEYYKDSRRRGTLICYNRHSVNENIYQEIGRQDITSHVNFSALCHWGFKYGLDFTGFTDQSAFLLNLGFKELLRKTLEQNSDLLTAARQEAYVTRKLLLDMGTRFKVLIQQKGIYWHKLTGMPSL